MDLSDFLWAIILVPFFIGLYKYKDFDKTIKWMFYFVCSGVLNEIATQIFNYFDFSNIMPKRHLYTFISFLFLGLFYDSLFRGFFRKNWILVVVIAYEIYFVISAFFIQGIYIYPDRARSISTILIVLFSILYFYKTMVKAEIKSLFEEPLIWINSAILIYFSGSLFFHILFNLIFEYSKEFGGLTFFYFKVLNVLFYILIAIGFGKVKSAKQ